MAREGATVYATDVNREAARTISRASPTSSTRVLDVLDDAAVATLVDELPPLDVLFNCAGYVHHGTDPRVHAEGLGLQLQPQRPRDVRDDPGCTLPKMLAKHRADAASGSSIINMASIAASDQGICPTASSTARRKAAVDRAHQGGRRRFRDKGHSLQRDRARAPSTRRRSASGSTRFDDPVEARKMFIARQPMGRLAKAEEIAPLVVFLASDESAFVDR